MIDDRELVRLLDEDCPYGDLTTVGLGIGSVPAQARLVARSEMTLAGVEQAARLFALCGATVRIAHGSGTSVAGGTTILEASGDGGGLHRCYKVAQTLLEILGGVASSARQIVAAATARRPGCRVACTRKHLPGIKRWALAAIEAGGAVPHRLGLSDSVLVFDAHRALLDPAEPAAAWIARLRASAPERRIAVEADEVAQALGWAEAGADVVQVDKLAPAQVAEIARAFAARSPRPLLLAAGGIHAGNAGDYAAAGADVLVTSAPYTAPPRDVKVVLARA